MDSSDSASVFNHRPVMISEVVDTASDAPRGLFLDATVGGAGHAQAILEACPDLGLIGLDRDPNALSAAGAKLARFGDRVALRRVRFDRLGEVLTGLGCTSLSGFLFDLGVSSPQLDVAERGFSFRNDGPLDMRMDPDAPTTAADVVNTYNHGQLAQILHRHADEKFASRIAEAIISARPIDRTVHLAEVVVSAIPAPARRKGGHPAKRTFQAIRIEVNDELRVIEPALETALDALGVGGRGMVLTYHSGEDRVVSRLFRQRSESQDPPGLPVEVAKPDFRVIRPSARKPQPEELAQNPRASSARLRSIERLAA